MTVDAGEVDRHKAGAVVRQHPWSLHWVRLQATVTAVRSVLGPLQMLGRLFEAPMPPTVAREVIQVPSRDPHRTITVHVYRPNQVRPGRRYPATVNWHGSGFVLPCLGQDQLYCSRLSAHIDNVVLDADYRKAPEHPFPAAIEDAEDVVRWASSSPAQLPQLDLDRLALSGFSAGANLALAVALRFGPERIVAVSVFYPPTEMSYDPANVKEKHPPKPTFKYGVRLTKGLNIIFRQSYIVKGTDDTVQEISPINADPRAWPGVVHIACGDGDRLWGDGDRLIKKLKEAGHPNATFDSIAEAGHGFDKVQRTAEGQAVRDAAYKAAWHAIELGQAGKVSKW